MRRATLLSAAALALAAPSAYAVDWSVTSNVSESVEVNDNPQLTTKSPGMAYNSYTALSVDVLGATPTSRFETIGNLKYRAYGGPGEEGQLNAWDKDITSRYEFQNKLTRYNVFGSYNEVQSSAQQLVETGLSTATGSTITKTIGGGVRHEFTSTDTGGLNATFNSVDFTGTGGSPYNSLTTSLDWRHRATELIDFVPSLQLQHLAYDDAAQSRVLFAVATLGFQVQFDPRTSLYVSAGPTWEQATNNGGPTTAPAIAGGAIGPSGLPSGSGFDWNAAAQVSYRWTPSLTLAVNASRVTGPTSFGSFQSSEQVSGSLVYNINLLSSISFTEGFSHVAGSAGAGGYDLITTTVGYSRRLTREWTFGANYQYIQRNSDQAARSNSILLTLSKSFTILPP